MKRRFFVTASIVSLLAACSQTSEPDIPLTVKEETPINKLHNSSIASHNSLIFGNLNESSEKLTLVLDLGEDQTLDFLTANIVSLERMFENKKPFEILLVNTAENNTFSSSTFYDMSFALSAVAMVAYVEDPEIFFGFLNNLIERYSSQENVIKEDALYIAKDLDLLPNLDLRGNNAISRQYIEKMTVKAAELTSTVPAILVNDSLWEGSLNNPTETNILWQ